MLPLEKKTPIYGTTSMEKTNAEKNLEQAEQALIYAEHAVVIAMGRVEFWVGQIILERIVDGKSVL